MPERRPAPKLDLCPFPTPIDKIAPQGLADRVRQGGSEVLRVGTDLTAYGYDDGKRVSVEGGTHSSEEASERDLGRKSAKEGAQLVEAFPRLSGALFGPLLRCTSHSSLNISTASSEDAEADRMMRMADCSRKRISCETSRLMGSRAFPDGIEVTKVFQWSPQGAPSSRRAVIQAQAQSATCCLTIFSASENGMGGILVEWRRKTVEFQHQTVGRCGIAKLRPFQ